MLFIDFSKAFVSINREKMLKILLSYTNRNSQGSMLYQNTRSMVRSPDGDTDFFEISAGVLQGHTSTIYWGKRRPRLHTWTQEKQEISRKENNRWFICLRRSFKDASTLLHLIEETANSIGVKCNKNIIQLFKPRLDYRHKKTHITNSDIYFLGKSLGALKPFLNCWAILTINIKRNLARTDPIKKFEETFCSILFTKYRFSSQICCNLLFP